MPPPRDTGADERFHRDENDRATTRSAAPWKDGPESSDRLSSALNLVSSTEVTVYDNEVPDFVGPELDRLYGTLYSSLSYFHACDGLDGVSTYVARRKGVVTAIFLFLHDRGKVMVVNEGMRLQAEEISQFARHVFSTFRSVGAIVFHAVQANDGGIPFVHHKSFCAEDFIARLPETQEAYFARLGAATRKNIKRHKNRLTRDFPSFEFRVHPGREADERDLRRVIELNRIRMERKGMTSYIDEGEMQKIIRLVRQCGEALVARIDGKVCGGTLFYRIGKNYLSKVNSHDPAYDNYRLGMLCCYAAICEAIDHGAAHFHLGHTRYEYKTALLGEFERFDHIVIYRSVPQLLRNGRAALKEVLGGYSLEANRWFLLNIDREEPAWRLAKKALNAWRAIKSRKT